LSGFGVGIEGGLVLLKEFLFDSDVVVSNAEYNHAVLRLSALGRKATLVFITFHFRFTAHFGYELVLDQN
jgi:hypothetical protein